jgi:hypothetical protein
MTRSQVRALFPTAVEDGTILRLSRTSSWMGATWRSVMFVFDPSGALVTVVLDSTSTDFLAVETAMKARFGPPIYIGPHDLTFRAQRGGDVVEVVVAPNWLVPPDGGILVSIKPGSSDRGRPGR